MPVLNPCYFWLWVFLKDRAYVEGIKTSSELKVSITRHAVEICQEFIQTTVLSLYVLNTDSIYAFIPLFLNFIANKCI